MGELPKSGGVMGGSDYPPKNLRSFGGDYHLVFQTSEVLPCVRIVTMLVIP